MLFVWLDKGIGAVTVFVALVGISHWVIRIRHILFLFDINPETKPKHFLNFGIGIGNTKLYFLTISKSNCFVEYHCNCLNSLEISPLEKRMALKIALITTTKVSKTIMRLRFSIFYYLIFPLHKFPDVCIIHQKEKQTDFLSHVSNNYEKNDIPFYCPKICR